MTARQLNKALGQLGLKQVFFADNVRIAASSRRTMVPGTFHSSAEKRLRRSATRGQLRLTGGVPGLHSLPANALLRGQAEKPTRLRASRTTKCDPSSLPAPRPWPSTQRQNRNQGSGVSAGLPSGRRFRRPRSALPLPSNGDLEPNSSTASAERLRISAPAAARAALALSDLAPLLNRNVDWKSPEVLFNSNEDSYDEGFFICADLNHSGGHQSADTLFTSVAFQILSTGMSSLCLPVINTATLFPL